MELSDDRGDFLSPSLPKPAILPIFGVAISSSHPFRLM
jgi:hypothetical protein